MNHKTFNIEGSADNFSFSITEDLGDKKVTYLWENLTEQELKNLAYPHVTNFYNKVGVAKAQLPHREEERDSLITALQGAVDNYDYRAVFSAANNIEGTYSLTDGDDVNIYQFVNGDIIQQDGTDVGNYRLYAANFIAIDLGDGYKNFFSSDSTDFTDLGIRTLRKFSVETLSASGGGLSVQV